MYFRFVNSYTVMLVVQQLPCFCRPQVGKLQEPTQVSSGTNRSCSGDERQSAISSLLQNFGVGHCADTPVIIIHVHINV